jgi:glycolate oxidase subunit GlcD
MFDLTADFSNIVGSTNVIANEQKEAWGKDYTKAFKPNPSVIILPETTEQVSEVLKYCSAHKLAVVPSGGRTGLSGGAVAAKNEVVISTSRMKKIFGINIIEKTLHAQAGVVTKEIHHAAEEKNLYFPVDFASTGSSQIGGNIATNAGGIKVIRYGLTRAWVLGLQTVLADGTILDMQNACIKNNTGYDLKHLFIGAEGTLGIITEVLLKLTSPPGKLLVSLFSLESLDKVVSLFSLAQSSKLSLTAYEFFTDFAMARVKEHTKLQSPFQGTHPFYVLLETEQGHKEDEQKLEAFLNKALEDEIISDGVMAQSSQQERDFWGLRENISESLSALTVAHKNDISLPLSQLAAFSSQLEKLIAQKYPDFEVVLFGHIGDGNLHVNFVKPGKMSKEEFFKYAHSADDSMFQLVKSFGGSISAEHGIGLTKKDFLHYSRSPQEIAVMKNIKSVLDPHGIMNPGKIF